MRMSTTPELQVTILPTASETDHISGFYLIKIEFY